jgi:hypothetical protein
MTPASGAPRFSIPAQDPQAVYRIPRPAHYENSGRHTRIFRRTHQNWMTWGGAAAIESFACGALPGKAVLASHSFSGAGCGKARPAKSGTAQRFSAKIPL